MADPQLNEAMILDILDVPVSLEMAERLQSGALMSVLDAYDRKILRDPFTDIVAAALTLNQQLGRASLAQAVHNLIKSDGLTEEKVTATIKHYLERAEEQKAKIIKIMELVVQCPKKGDTIN